MLTISGDLTALVTAEPKRPYIKVVITTNEGVAVETFERDSASPLIYMREDAQVWSGELEVLLWNGDTNLSAKNYTGRRINPHWGYANSGGTEYSAEHAPYWVVDQEFVTFSGTSYLKLTCWSVWDIMGIKAIGGDANDAVPLFNENFDKSIATIIDDILDAVKLKGFAAGINLTVPVGNLDVTSDFFTGIFKGYKPQIAAEWGQAARNVIRLIMDLTYCGLRFRADGMHVLYPADGDAINFTYLADDSTLAILASSLHDAIAVPNRIIYVDKLPDTLFANDTHKGEANDTVSQNRIGLITQIYSPQATTDIGNNTGDISGANEAQQRAETILGSIQKESSTGILTTRPHPALEVWDKISAIDPISNVTTTGRIGRVETIWDGTGLAAPRDRYIQNIELGGLSLRSSNLASYINQAIYANTQLGEGETLSPIDRPPPVTIPFRGATAINENAGTITPRSVFEDDTRTIPFPERFADPVTALTVPFKVPDFITVQPSLFPAELFENMISPETEAALSSLFLSFTSDREEDE